MLRKCDNRLEFEERAAISDTESSFFNNRTPLMCNSLTLEIVEIRTARRGKVKAFFFCEVKS